MNKNRKKVMRTAAIVASVANGCWASVTEAGHGTNWSPVILAVMSVWVGYFALTWLAEGMKSKRP
jgi:hypothetical protein